MIKWIVRKVKEFYDNEYEGSIQFEFSIYDLIFFIVFVLGIIWIIFR